MQRSNIPTSQDLKAFLVNKGEIKNTGVELALDFNIISKEDFNFSVGGNIAWNKTKITNLESQALEDFYIDGIA